MPKPLTQHEYINKAVSVHGDKYDYTKTTYTKAHNYVTITCSTHGDFTQKACNHINAKQGCPKCSGNVLTHGEFIEKCTIVHDNFYDYSKTTYVKAHDKVTIICPTHGEFTQQAYVHLQGHKCPECGKATTVSKIRNRPSTWSYSGWETAGTVSNAFSGFSLYVVECWNDSEHFIKIGKTFNDINRRFTKGAIPYEWKLLHLEIGSASYISKVEAELHAQLNHHKYTPQIKFNGYQECYLPLVKDLYGANLTTTINTGSHQQ